MGGKEARAFAQALESHDSALERLVLRGACVMISMFFSDVSFLHLAASSHLISRFSDCQIGTQGAQHLARALASPNCKLHTLDLFGE